MGEWLPEPLLTSPDLAEDAEFAENVSIAMLMVLETLGPAERAVFVLHEVFETPYDEIADIVGKTTSAVRQIAHRARAHVAARRPRMQVDRVQQEATLEKFMAAISSGDLQGLLDVLAPDVVLIADGGGLVAAARKPMVGSRGWRRSSPGWWSSRTSWRPLPGSTECPAPVSTSMARPPRSVWWSRTAGSPGSTPSAIHKSWDGWKWWQNCGGNRPLDRRMDLSNWL